ncbi:MAG: molybdate ABC transporter permease subunit, partial [Coriobacteriales bacterium]
MGKLGKKPLACLALSFATVLIVCLLALGISQNATAEESSSESSSTTATATIDKDGTSATIDGLDFGITDFTRAQKGSNRSINGTYYGYYYLTGDSPDMFSAVYVDLESEDPYVVLYIPSSVSSLVSVSDSSQLASFENLLGQLDEANANGGYTLSTDEMTWYVTDSSTYQVNGLVFSFSSELKDGRYYTTIIREDGTDPTDDSTGEAVDFGHCSYGQIAEASSITVTTANEGWAAVQEFFAEMDYGPLFVTLKTVGVSIVFIFILGLLAAYWTMTLKPKMQSIMDAIFTIPMVLPPTVCGFLLLLALGSSSPLGQWFIDIGFPLVFSWPATVIAAVVVAFPLMYRSARGAFEGLDSNMLDAARTLGWSNFKIFRKLMIPLAWTSIAAGTALSFARALGEFGATLFLAGNYAGITQTIPIAI